MNRESSGEVAIRLPLFFSSRISWGAENTGSFDQHDGEQSRTRIGWGGDGLECSGPSYPFRAGRAWHLPRQLDPFTLREALDLFVGRHDFEAFGAKRGYETEETSFVRTVTAVELAPIEWGWPLTHSGDGFLYKMVRLLTGAAIQATQGRLGLDPIRPSLASRRDLLRRSRPIARRRMVSTWKGWTMLIQIGSLAQGHDHLFGPSRG